MVDAWAIGRRCHRHEGGTMLATVICFIHPRPQLRDTSCICVFGPADQDDAGTPV